MWQILAQQALDLACERTEEARLEALASEARRLTAEERRLHGLQPSPGPAKATTARMLRAASGAFESVAEAAHEAARRLDGRTA